MSGAAVRQSRLLSLTLLALGVGFRGLKPFIST